MTVARGTWVIEIERVGPRGYITRYARRGRVERFSCMEDAQALADQLDAQAPALSHGYTRYEVLLMLDRRTSPSGTRGMGMKGEWQ